MSKVKSTLLKIVTYGGSATALFGILFYEGSLVAIIALLGPIKAFVVLSMVTVVFANVLILILSKGNSFILSERLKAWTEKRQETMTPLISKALNIGKLLGIAIASITVGPLPTVLLINVLGYKKPFNFVMATFSSILFCLVWVTIYGGGIKFIMSVCDLFNW